MLTTFGADRVGADVDEAELLVRERPWRRLFIGSIMSKDEPMMMSKPCPAARASVDWKSEIARGWMTTYSTPRSVLAFSMPSTIMSLKDLSPRPDSEVTIATLGPAIGRNGCGESEQWTVLRDRSLDIEI